MAKLKYRVRVVLGDQELVLLVPVPSETTVGELETILVTTVGRVPVITDSGRLLGIVTRTDLLRLRNYHSTLPAPSASR